MTYKMLIDFQQLLLPDTLHCEKRPKFQLKEKKRKRLVFSISVHGML